MHHIVRSCNAIPKLLLKLSWCGTFQPSPRAFVNTPLDREHRHTQEASHVSSCAILPKCSQVPYSASIAPTAVSHTAQQFTIAPRPNTGWGIVFGGCRKSCNPFRKSALRLKSQAPAFGGSEFLVGSIFGFRHKCASIFNMRAMLHAGLCLISRLPLPGYCDITLQ